jgi:hypothetical protein
MDGMRDIDRLFFDMVDKGLAYTSSTWIERAVAQKHHNLKVQLANSRPLAYDAFDVVLLRKEKLN